MKFRLGRSRQSRPLKNGRLAERIFGRTVPETQYSEARFAPNLSAKVGNPAQSLDHSDQTQLLATESYFPVSEFKTPETRGVCQFLRHSLPPLVGSQLQFVHPSRRDLSLRGIRHGSGPPPRHRRSPPVLSWTVGMDLLVDEVLVPPATFGTGGPTVGGRGSHLPDSSAHSQTVPQRLA
jgi:hypothetical protein